MWQIRRLVPQEPKIYDTVFIPPLVSEMFGEIPPNFYHHKNTISKFLLTVLPQSSVQCVKQRNFSELCELAGGGDTNWRQSHRLKTDTLINRGRQIQHKYYDPLIQMFDTTDVGVLHELRMLVGHRHEAWMEEVEQSQLHLIENIHLTLTQTFLTPEWGCLRTVLCNERGISLEKKDIYLWGFLIVIANFNKTIILLSHCTGFNSSEELPHSLNYLEPKKDRKKYFNLLFQLYLEKACPIFLKTLINVL